jgi:hypothetical protein
MGYPPVADGRFEHHGTFSLFLKNTPERKGAGYLGMGFKS